MDMMDVVDSMDTCLLVIVHDVHSVHNVHSAAQPQPKSVSGRRAGLIPAFAIWRESILPYARKHLFENRAGYRLYLCLHVAVRKPVVLFTKRMG